MTRNTEITSVAYTLKKIISVQLFLMNILLHIMMINIMVLEYCSNGIQLIVLTTLINKY